MRWCVPLPARSLSAPELLLQILQARSQALRRQSRVLAVEDLLFLIRHDRAKVARLRTFLSWRDVRAKVRESEQDDWEPMEQYQDGPLVAARLTLGLPWEMESIYGEGFLGNEEEGREEREAFEVARDVLRVRPYSPAVRAAVTLTPPRREPGSGRAHVQDDKGAVPALRGLPSGILHLPQRFVP